MNRVSLDGAPDSRAIASPAGSDGVGGLLIRRRYGTHVRIVHPRESGGISNREVGKSTA